MKFRATKRGRPSKYGHSPKHIDAYVENNIKSLKDVKRMLADIAKAVLLDRK